MIVEIACRFKADKKTSLILSKVNKKRVAQI